MRTKNWVVQGAFSMNKASSRKICGISSGKSGGSSSRVASKPRRTAQDDEPLSPEFIRELKRRLRDSRDPLRYMLVSEFSRRFILYYDVTSDTYAMNNPSSGTLFKRREAAESVKNLLGKNVTVVKFTTKGGKLKRLSAYRGPRIDARERTA